MSHQKIHDVMVDLMNDLAISVIRECTEYDSQMDPNLICCTRKTMQNDMLKVKLNEPDSENAIDGTEEYIAEIISGEAELLKSHNVMG